MGNLKAQAQYHKTEIICISAILGGSSVGNYRQIFLAKKLCPYRSTRLRPLCPPSRPPPVYIEHLAKKISLDFCQD